MQETEASGSAKREKPEGHENGLYGAVRDQDAAAVGEIDAEPLRYANGGSGYAGVTSICTGCNFYHSHLNGLFRLGAVRPLQHSDLGQLPKDVNVDECEARFRAAWEKECQDTSIAPEKRSLWRCVLATVGVHRIALIVLFSAFNSGSIFAVPLLQKAIVTSQSASLNHLPGELPTSELWTLIALMLFIPLAAAVLGGQSESLSNYVSVQIRNALTKTIYKKCLVMGPSAQREHSIGMITNMFGRDVMMVEAFTGIISGVIFCPAQLATGLGLVYNLLGISMFVAVGYFFTSMPFLLATVVIVGINFRALQKESDGRIKLTNEILGGIRIVKYYAWEHAFRLAIEEVRKRELEKVLSMMYAWCSMELLINLSPVAMPVLVFYCYVRLGNSLDYVSALTTLSYFIQITGAVAALPHVLNSYVQAQGSFARIRNFLSANDLEDYVVRGENVAHPDVVVSFEHAFLGWSLEEEAKKKREEEEKKKQEEEEKKRKEEAARFKPEAAATNATNNVELTEIKTAESSSHRYATVASSEDVPATASDVDLQLEDAIGLEDRAVHTLKDITVSIKKGQLVAVVGGVGSGKSSILAALLGELRLKSGKVSMTGAIGYHQQQPWIINSTIKENIIFGLPFDEKKFSAVLHAAALEDDIKVLPSGLDTEIGERGINLSGGQKARVSLARCLYREADIFLLDDPLSAVDAHVGEHIFKHAICTTLKGAGKTVILVTHQVHILAACDVVLVVEKGEIKAAGSMEEIAKAGIDLHAFVSNDEDKVKEEEKEKEEYNKHEGKEEERRGEERGEADAGGSGAAGGGDRRERAGSSASTDSQNRNRSSSISKGRSSSSSSSSSKSNNNKSTKDEKTAGLDNGKVLMTEEERATGTVNTEVYMWYARGGGILFLLANLFFAAGSVSLQNLSSFKIKDWGAATVNAYVTTGKGLTNEENMQFVNYYAMYSLLGTVGLTIRTIFGCLHAYHGSKYFHNKLLRSVLGAKLSFFDVTPIGRILNRFSKDIGAADLTILYFSTATALFTLQVLGTITTIAITTNGTFLLLLVPLALCYYKVQVYFTKTNTELARLDSIANSPILTELSQTLSGLSSLRAYGVQSGFASRMSKRIQDRSVIHRVNSLVYQWLQMRLGSLGATISFFITVLQVTSGGFISPEDLSLAILYAQTLPMICGMLVMMYAQLEAQMNSIERIKHYVDTVQQEEGEEQLEKAQLVAATLPAEWPSKGAIVAKNLQMRYRDGPLVLKGLDLSIREGEKIGIAGRTGSGKSSLMVALFRMEQLVDGGSIFIDGVDIAAIPLSILRSRIGIIPQDAVMFSATLRFNLDPFTLYDDERIWDVLASVGLKEMVLSLPLKLEEPVSEGGSNFSQGQRQLICFARALLRDPKILVLDEATASIDNENDAEIQALIRTTFKQCTVLTIAHRLNTIIDSDRCLVLDQGTLAEFDEPAKLLAKEDGIFASLWKQFELSHNTK